LSFSYGNDQIQSYHFIANSFKVKTHKKWPVSFVFWCMCIRTCHKAILSLTAVQLDVTHWEYKIFYMPHETALPSLKIALYQAHMHKNITETDNWPFVMWWLNVAICYIIITLKFAASTGRQWHVFLAAKSSEIGRKFLT
jgi:hypothetical protein